ncbi:MAG: phosphoribosylglycinamide formyltransferase [Gloeobacteraceae cyanobacterium ES-bin-316]|nr:phosphoribosylglycinamide formyltransferase [Ferruginibacter sp.]
MSLAIFASGAGSNALEIIKHFKKDAHVRIALIVCNKTGAGVIEIAKTHGIPILLIEKDRFFRGDSYLQDLKKYQLDFLVLAGFLWKIPVALIKQWPSSIINIHPALLPKYGGKGMYGRHVHEAVIHNKEEESGISIHYVDEVYDHGAIIFQATCAVSQTDTAQSLAQKIHELEHLHYPTVIEELIKAKNSLNKQVAPTS